MLKATFTFGYKIAGALCLLFSFSPNAAEALEVSQIPQATAQEPSCTNNIIYIEFNHVSGQKSNGPCRNCKSTVTSAVQAANAQLNSAKGADASINASTTAGTAATAATVDPLQKAHQFGAQNVASNGNSALTQQQQLAQQTSQAMKKCAADIRQACGGDMAPEDKSAADQSAQSCEQAGTTADQVAAEKGMKAAEAAKNAAQAGQQGQAMTPPQMPQGGPQGAGDQGSADPLQSNLSSNVPDKIEPTKLDNAASSKLGNADATNLGEIGNQNTSNISDLSQLQDPSFASGGGGATAAGDSRSLASAGGEYAGGAATGVSTTGASGGSGAGGGGGAGSGSGAGEGDSSALAGALGGNTDDSSYGLGGGGGGSRPTLGLKSSGDEFTDLLGGAAGAGSSGELGALGDGAKLAANSQNAPWQGFTDESLFKRVKRKIHTLSTQRHMQ